MTTINLYQSSNENEKSTSSRNANMGFYFSLGILILTAAALVGLKIYVPILKGESAALDATITTENNKVVGLKNLENVIDMQKRLVEIKNNLQIKNGEVTRLEMNQILDNLGSDLAGGVVVSEYAYDPDKIVVKLVANNFNDAAKQILNFKTSKYFTDVNLTDISRQEQGVSCNIAMKIKK